MEKDWTVIWEKEIEERKEKLTQYVKKRESDIEILGDYLQSTLKKCKYEDVKEINYCTLAGYFSDNFNGDFIFQKELPKPSEDVKKICSNIITDILGYNLYHDFKVYGWHPLSVLNVENVKEFADRVYYNTDPVKYILGLFHQHIIKLESFHKYELKDVLHELKIPIRITFLFAFFLITLQEMFNLLEPWVRAAIFLEHFTQIKSEEGPYRFYLESKESEKLVVCFLSAIWEHAALFLFHNERDRYLYYFNYLEPEEGNELRDRYLKILKAKYEQEIKELEDNKDQILKDLDMKWYGIDEKKLALKNKVEKSVYNPNNFDACKIKPLHSLDIVELEPEESRKFGKFKIENTERSDEEYDTHNLTEILYIEKEGKWKGIFFNVLHDREPDFEHPKIRESFGSPLIRLMYVDVEDEIFYLETEDCILYASLDKSSWYRWNIEPEKRPYYGRLDKMRKFKIPN